MIYELKLTIEQLGLVGEALASMPYMRVAPLIVEIQKQVQAQQKEQNARVQS